MVLSAGSRLGTYEILAALGAGGMGEVYRAHDTKLNRDVAIKVLPAVFAEDPERIARFHREAQAVAALNHPHVAAIYELAEAETVRFLVLELVEGDTLAERIGRGRLPADEALAIATQICEALEAAHEKGIVHRDLKPANVKITPDGNVKVLDFGLAKARENAASSVALSNSPTISLAATQAGMILGTAAYMSPEQAKGLAADHRSDVFSFGCVLYEMLTGRQAFDGDTVSEILASVLKSEADLNLLPPRLNPRIRELLRRCLAKNPKDRWHAATDVRVEIQAAVGQGVLVEPGYSAGPRPVWKRPIPVGLGMFVAGVITGLGVWILKPPPPPATITLFPILLAEGQDFTVNRWNVVAISPDGTLVAYCANDQLYLRSMSALEARPIPGTLRARHPVFSPDGRSLAFYSLEDGVFKRITVAGGSTVTLGPGDTPYGISWGEDGIVIGQGSKGVIRISANGGPPEVIVKVAEGDLAYGPQVLPGGTAVLFTILAGAGSTATEREAGRIVVQSLESGERKTLVEGGSDARYVPTGHIVYGRGGTILAAPFDARRLQVTGESVPVVEGVRQQGDPGLHFSFSESGSLIYVPGSTVSSAQRDLAWSEPNGVAVPLKLPAGPYQRPRISPNGRQVAFETDNGREANVWIYDLDGRSSMRRLTFGGRNRFPIWSADSDRVAFQSDREGDAAIFWQKADGTGGAERLTKPEEGTAHAPESWSPDGEHFLFRAAKGTEVSLWTYSLKDKTALPFGDVQTSNPTNAVFSPDGRWVAYHAREAGTNFDEVFVEPFPATGAKYQLPIKRQNHHPLWLSGGKELFYDTGPGPDDAIVSVTTDRSVAFGNPVPTTIAVSTVSPQNPRPFDVTPDGKRFIGIVAAEQSQDGIPLAPQIQVVLNWFEDLKARVPVR